MGPLPSTNIPPPTRGGPMRSDGVIQPGQMQMGGPPPNMGGPTGNMVPLNQPSLNVMSPTGK